MFKSKNKFSASQVGFKEAVAVLAVIVIIMSISVIGLKITPEVPILVGIMLLILWAKCRGFTWNDIDGSFMVGIKNGIVPLFIFLLIGSLIGVWITAGIIPTLMVYGFKFISIRWFLPSVFIICCVMGTIIGSAFTVMSTLGIAAMGIGITLGINPAIIAGAVVSGAVFGDKTSPLSVSTNVAAASVGANLIDHIKNLLWSTIPSAIVSAILYFILGRHNGSASLSRIHVVSAILQNHFDITLWALVPVILLFICAWLKMPTIPTLFLNITISVVFILIEHPGFSLVKLDKIISSGFVSHTGNHLVDSLLTHGGIASMMNSFALIFIALSFGGLLMNLGIMRAIMEPIAKRLHSTFQLIISVLIACIGVNIFIGEQFLSLILPGSAFKKTFIKHNLAPVALSRALEDGGTVIDYLVPWSVAGTFVTSVLNVPTLHYLPFAFLSLLSPIFSILSAATGIGIKHLKSTK